MVSPGSKEKGEITLCPLFYMLWVYKCIYFDFALYKKGNPINQVRLSEIASNPHSNTYIHLKLLPMYSPYSCNFPNMYISMTIMLVIFNGYIILHFVDYATLYSIAFTVTALGVVSKLLWRHT